MLINANIFYFCFVTNYYKGGSEEGNSQTPTNRFLSVTNFDLNANHERKSKHGSDPKFVGMGTTILMSCENRMRERKEKEAWTNLMLKRENKAQHDA